MKRGKFPRKNEREEKIKKIREKSGKIMGEFLFRLSFSAWLFLGFFKT
jgi:hypothetical protein